MSRTPHHATKLSHAGDGAWRQLVKSTLAGRHFEALVRRSDDDIEIGPIYVATEATQLPGRRPPIAPWTVVQRVDDPDTDRRNRSVAEDLAGGAGGIELLMADGSSAKRTGFGLDDVDDELVAMLSDKSGYSLRLDGGEATYARYRRLADVAVAELTLSYDPLAHAAARGGFDRRLVDVESDIAKTTWGFIDSRQPGSAVVADGRIWAAAGASEAQEIAGILGSIVHEMRVLVATGLAPQQALESIGIVVDAGANQLLTIAKIRAVRLCHARVGEAFGSAPGPARIHAETSWRMMTRYDAHTNILRTTSAAFAAGIGGADSITVLPFTCAVGLADGFARRIARNSQSILLEESGLGRVGDPGAGSGAIESLTDALADTAWKKFTELEAVGGLLAALRAGSFQRDIAAMRRVRARKIAHRAIPLTGVSAFPDPEFTEPPVVARRPPVATEPTATVERIANLETVRLAEPFEALRDRATALADAGRTPKIYLAYLGTPAGFADAAQDAINYFAAGGIRVCNAGNAGTVSDEANAFVQSGARVACIVGSQPALDQGAAPTAAALKAVGAARVYVLGGTPSSEAIDAVLDQSIDATAVLEEVLASTP